MTLPSPSVNVVLMDKYTKAVLNNYNLSTDNLTIYEEGVRQNFNNDIVNIMKAVGNIHPLALDLYRIAYTVYFADLQIRRKDPTNNRFFGVLISVTDETRWNLIKPKLEATLSKLTGDNFEFYFIGNQQSIGPLNTTESTGKGVCLFSGGLDSLAGVKWLLDNSIEPIMVSHCSLPIACTAQRKLSKELSRISNRELTFNQINCKPHKGIGMQKETTQQSRSFLFLTIAVMFAIQKGITSVYMFENGILALNIPISNSRIYANTRTAHPTFIMRYNELLQSIFGNRVSVQNPFLTKTKGEVTKNLNDAPYADLIKTSISCSHTANLRYQGIKLSEISHCGKCYPCIIRQVSVHAANLWDKDAKYKDNLSDAFDSRNEDGKVLLLELFDFVRTLKGLSTDLAVLSEFTQFYLEGADPSEMISVYKRHIEEIEVCFREKASEDMKINLHLN